MTQLKKIFGTDGVRGTANIEPVKQVELAFKVSGELSVPYWYALSGAPVMLIVTLPRIVDPSAA